MVSFPPGSRHSTRQCAIWWQMVEKCKDDILPVSVQTHIPHDSKSENSEQPSKRRQRHYQSEKCLGPNTELPVLTHSSNKVRLQPRKILCIKLQTLSQGNFALGQGLYILKIRSKILLALFTKFWTMTTSLFVCDIITSGSPDH